MIRVAIVAESAVHRAGLASVIGAEPDVRIIATSTRHDAERLSADGLFGLADVDVVIVVPGREPESAFSGVSRDASDLDAPRGAATMVLLEELETTDALDAYAAGASAVLAIDASAEELRAALRAVAAGLTVFPSGVSGHLLVSARRVASDSRGRPASTASLTSREREVLTLLAQGLANKVIASRLGITEHTVKTHIAAVYEKLDARNRAEVLVAAARQGLVML